MRLILYLAASLLAICGTGTAQQINVGHTTVVMTDASRGNRKIPADIYYPSASGGADAPVLALQDRKYPVICFAHAYFTRADSYSNIWETLVPEGYIMIFPKTEEGMFPSHYAFAEDILFILAEATRYGRDERSMFHNLVDTMNCAMGHSMGGGSSWLAASLSPGTIRSVVLLTPLFTKALASTADISRTMPLLIMSGSNDCITSTSNHSMPIYNQSAASHKTLIEINGANHCNMGEKMALCNAGEAMTLCTATISKEEQHAIIERYLVPWLRHFLKGDTDAGIHLDQTLKTDTSISFYGLSRNPQPAT